MDFQDGELPFTDNGQVDYDVRDLPNLIEKNLALLFLKLESIQTWWQSFVMPTSLTTSWVVVGLSSAYKRREQFAVVELEEYVLSREEDRSFQYVRIPK